MSVLYEFEAELMFNVTKTKVPCRPAMKSSLVPESIIAGVNSKSYKGTFVASALTKKPWPGVITVEAVVVALVMFLPNNFSVLQLIP